jgi:hypothetical protein
MLNQDDEKNDPFSIFPRHSGSVADPDPHYFDGSGSVTFITEKDPDPTYYR